MISLEIWEHTRPAAVLLYTKFSFLERHCTVSKMLPIAVIKANPFKILTPVWCGAAIECWPVNQRVTSLIPSQGTSLGCRPGPQWGVHRRQPHIDVFLPLPLPSPLSKKINEILNSYSILQFMSGRKYSFGVNMTLTPNMC